MGAETFITTGTGKTVEDAFRSAVNNAEYESGHGGYTGTVAEKNSFVVIELPDGANVREYIDKLIDDDDARIDDKWGPAGAIKVTEDKWVFFGWASS